MKKWRKFKQKMSKKWKSFKNWLKDQSFYLNRFLSSATRQLFQLMSTTVKIAALAVIMMFSALGANKYHLKYLESYVGDNVVYIEAAPDAQIRGSGTGFQMQTPSGKVITVTNAHICEMANSKGELMLMEKRYSKRLVPKKVIEVFKDNDLCVVEGLAGYEGLKLGSKPEVGQPVWSLGHPLGQSLHISDGRIKDFGKTWIMDEIPLEQCNSSRHQIKEVMFFFFPVKVCLKSYESAYTSLVIYGGNSGSPMVDMWGRVVGVIFAGNVRTNWGSSVIHQDLENLLKAY